MKTRNYCNNVDLTNAIIDYQKLCRKNKRNEVPLPTMPKYIGECIYNICNRLTKGFNFNFQSYTYRDEMVLDAIERCCYAVHKFNHKKSSAGAFAYLTTVAINAQKKRIKDEQKVNYIKHKFFRSQFTNHEMEGIEPNELSDKVIGDYEDKAAAKKKGLTYSPKPNKM